VLGVAVIGGLWWLSKQPNSNPVGSRGPTKATQIKRIQRELDGWRNKLASQEGYSLTHYGNKDAGNSFIHKTIAMYEKQLAELHEGMGRNPTRQPTGSLQEQLDKAKRDLAKVRQRLDDWEEEASSKPTQAQRMHAMGFLRSSTIYRREYTREYNLKKLIGRLSMSV